MKREQLTDDELRELLMQRKIRSREARVAAYRASGRIADPETPKPAGSSTAAGAGPSAALMSSCWSLRSSRSSASSSCWDADQRS